MWRNLKRCVGSWNCWDSFRKDTQWCILTQCFVLKVGTAEKRWKARTLNGAFSRNLKRCLIYVGTAEKMLKQRRLMVYSGVIWSDVLEVRIAEKCWKQGRYMGAFSRNLKRCFFWNWNSWEIYEIDDAKRCILTLFETMYFVFFNSLVKFMYMPDPLHAHFYCFFRISKWFISKVYSNV